MLFNAVNHHERSAIESHHEFETDSKGIVACIGGSAPLICKASFKRTVNFNVKRRSPPLSQMLDPPLACCIVKWDTIGLICPKLYSYMTNRLSKVSFVIEPAGSMALQSDRNSSIMLVFITIFLPL
jgi:hypothetical protein